MTHMRSAFLLLIVLAAGCVPLEPQISTPKPVPETVVYLEYAFEALPGWPSAGLERSLSAFRRGCPRPGPLTRACEAADLVPPGDEAAARLFFETSFVPYAVVSSEGVESGLITGYY